MATAPAYTPGPWAVSGKATINGGRGWIASVSTQNRDANARLIAAAPELLEALVWLEVYLRDTPHHNAPAAANARKVIAKAEGRS